MSLRNSPLHSWFCRKSWSLRRKGIPTSPQDSEELRLQSPKWLHRLEMPRSCPCVTNVTPALSACLWSGGTVTATLSVMCAPSVATTWNRRAISLWRIRSTVKSTPGSGSLHPRATMWSPCSLSEPAALHPTLLSSEPLLHLVLWKLWPLFPWKFSLTLVLSLLVS